MRKDLDDEVRFQQENPKRVGSEPYRRYAQYNGAKTVREALYLGAIIGDIAWDEAKGFMTRAPKRQAKKQAVKGKIMGGIVLDGKTYVVERFFCFLGIQARKQRSIEDAQASLRAIDRVLVSVQSRINKDIMAGKASTLEDFVAYFKAAKAEEQKASPELGVDEWRYYSKLRKLIFTESILQKLRKDPQVSEGVVEIRMLQDSMENALRGWLKLGKAAGLKELSDIVGIDGLDAGRRAADEFARGALSGLEEGERPSDAVVLKTLRLWGFDKSTSRQNVLPEGHEWVHSDTLGVIEARGDHSMIVTRACEGHQNFVRLLSSWARKRSPNQDLPFTTISLNKNYAGRLHRDSGNMGPSIGLAIGPFTGGRLCFWANDSGRGSRAHVEEVRKEPSALLNIKRGVVFDGNCAHEVQPFEGERYSLIFFTVKKYKKASDAVKRKMVQMGADWPTDASLKRLQAKVPRLSAKGRA